MFLESINSPRAPEAVGPYPHAKRCGNMLFLSGVGPRRRGTHEIPGVRLDASGNVVERDFAAQCLSVFENVRMIIEDAGARWDDIVDVAVYLTHLKEDWTTYNRLYAEWFAGPNGPRPTRTTVEVTALPTPISIELKVIVALRN